MKNIRLLLDREVQLRNSQLEISSEKPDPILMKAVLELTENLKKFDSFDPIKYDFALYRLGQEKII